MNEVKFIDLFAGLGGLRIGFENAFRNHGIKTKCILTSEIKTHALKSLEENFSSHNMAGDVTEVTTDEIDDFDFLLAGFPCQAFSSAGNRLGFLDTRGTLFFEVERILKAKRPYGFILENVEGLINHDKENKKDPIGRTLKTILHSLNSLGYNVKWELLDSQYFGVPQSRKRVFIVGTLKGDIDLENFDERTRKFKEIMEQGLETVNSDFTEKLLKHYDVKQLYGKAIKDKRGGKNNIHSWDFGLKGEITKEQNELLNALFKQRRRKVWAKEIGIKWMDGMPLTLEQIRTFYDHKNLKELLDDLVEKGYLKLEHPKDVVEKELENGKKIKRREYDTSKPKGYNIVTGKLSFEFSKILDINDIAPTIVATDVSKIGVPDGEGIRRITLREGLRLFGFPEDYTLEFFGNDEKGIRKGFDLLGNTVVVPVVEDVATKVAQNFLAYNNENYKQCIAVTV